MITRHDRTCRSVRHPLSPFSSHTHANIILAANPPLSRPFLRFKPSASRTSLSATLPLSLVTPTRRSTSVTAWSALDLHATRVSRVRRKLTRHVSAKDVKAVIVCWYVLLLLPLWSPISEPFLKWPNLTSHIASPQVSSVPSLPPTWRFLLYSLSIS